MCGSDWHVTELTADEYDAITEMRTKMGKLLTENDIQDLANEAERERDMDEAVVRRHSGVREAVGYLSTLLTDARNQAEFDHIAAQIEVLERDGTEADVMGRSAFQFTDSMLQEKMDQIATLLGEVNTILGEDSSIVFAVVAVPNQTQRAGE